MPHTLPHRIVHSLEYRRHLRAVDGLARLDVREDGVTHHHRVHVVVGAGGDHQVRVVSQAFGNVQSSLVRLEVLHSSKLSDDDPGEYISVSDGRSSPYTCSGGGAAKWVRSVKQNMKIRRVWCKVLLDDLPRPCVGVLSDVLWVRSGKKIEDMDASRRGAIRVNDAISTAFTIDG